MAGSAGERKFSFRLITSSYLPTIGGSEIEAQRVCCAMLERGHMVELYCPGGPSMPPVRQRVDEAGVPVRQFGNGLPARLRGYAFALGSAWRLFRDRAHYDLIYFLMPGLQVALGTYVARFTGKPVVMKFSGSNEVRRLRDSFIGRLQLSLLARSAYRIMVLNPGMVEEGIESGFRDEKMMRMPNPVDTAKFSPLPMPERISLRAKLSVEADALMVLYVGRLAPEKELGSLIEGFGQAAHRQQKARLYLLGDGPCRTELEQKARALCPAGSVVFTGARPVSEVCLWLQAADVFVLVSSLEGLPVSLLEAMSAGLPSVVSNIPGTLQLIEHQVEGLVAELRNAASIAAALELLFQDPAARHRMGGAARKRVEQEYSTTSVVALYEKLFTEAMAEAAK